MRFLLVLFISFFLSAQVHAQFLVDTLLTKQKLIETFMGEGVSIFNIKIHGSESSSGYFRLDSNAFPMDEGIVISTGRVSAITGQNIRPNMTTSMKESQGSDGDLARMVSRQIFNVTVIEFDFVPLYDSLFFDYVFASEEYPEYVGSPFNDVFCLLITGPNFPKPVNLARIGKPSNTVMINSVNQKKNKQFFIPNHKFKPSAQTPYTIEYDGFTTMLTASCLVTRGKMHHIKIAIGNVNDFSYDSGVFLRAGSFGSRGGGKSRFILPFDFDSHLIKETYNNLFDSLADVLKANPSWKLSILGHTDSLGSKEYNEELSYARAKEVADRLLAAGVSKKQIFIKGYGFKHPLSRNDSEEGRQRNRRVEMVILKRS